MSRTAVDPDSLRTHFRDELRRLRANAGLSRSRLATALGCTPQWLAKLESGERTVSPRTALDLDTYFKTEGWDSDDGLFVRLHRSLKSAQGSRVLLPGFEAYLEYEKKATVLCEYSAQVVPGLLQTEAYARGTMSLDTPEQTAESRVAGRLLRQELLTAKVPPVAKFVLDASVLLRPVGGAEVMAGQLLRLIELSALPRVGIHVLPFEPVIPAALDSSFTLLGFGDGTDLMYVETGGGAQIIQRPDLVMTGRTRFHTLMGEALSQAESVDLIRRRLEESR
ncbi:DNA-binding XRE family transcriptional regulator [Actinocorallia herbida]|uniref:DNA-binding XRE family transcriptional regulator n=1 Tax=Actinocorallia herbida TaxID=58109 RepID=A0A3N1CQG9_9ACTN|nr:helix-turn-helix transcriptional regulator [Actinocorallia herbida]ROO82968.1 DNA-binding XRE family transcriptional regulator [Actinocorallia herbida]